MCVWVGEGVRGGCGRDRGYECFGGGGGGGFIFVSA